MGCAYSIAPENMMLILLRIVSSSPNSPRLYTTSVSDAFSGWESGRDLNVPNWSER